MADPTPEAGEPAGQADASTPPADDGIPAVSLDEARARIDGIDRDIH